eukprot:6607716-Prymnesium_polylepis.1
MRARGSRLGSTTRLLALEAKRLTENKIILRVDDKKARVRWGLEAAALQDVSAAAPHALKKVGRVRLATCGGARATGCVTVRRYSLGRKSPKGAGSRTVGCALPATAEVQSSSTTTLFSEPLRRSCSDASTSLT